MKTAKNFFTGYEMMEKSSWISAPLPTRMDKKISQSIALLKDIKNGKVMLIHFAITSAFVNKAPNITPSEFPLRRLR